MLPLSINTNALNRPLSRRELLSSAVGALLLHETLRKPTHLSAPEAAQELSFILIWLDGGADLTPFQYLSAGRKKPNSETLLTSRFNANQICMPGLAGLRSPIRLLETLSHGEGQHQRARRLMLTGQADYRQMFNEPVTPASNHGFLSRAVESRLMQVLSHPDPLPEGPSLLIGEATDRRKKSATGRTSIPAFSSSFSGCCWAAAKLAMSNECELVIVMPGWDVHSTDRIAQIYDQYWKLDNGLTFLLDGLNQSDRLDNTIILCMSEFGRKRTQDYDGTSRFSHAPASTSALMAGEVLQNFSPELAGIQMDVEPPHTIAALHSLLRQIRNTAGNRSNTCSGC